MRRKSKSERELPVIWIVERVSPYEVYTFRWGRGSGIFTVHHGDMGTVCPNEHLIDTIHIGRDWADVADARAQARKWLQTRRAARRRNG